jgi:hypothetical protein
MGRDTLVLTRHSVTAAGMTIAGRKEEYDDFINAGSIGGYFNANIRNNLETRG